MTEVDCCVVGAGFAGLTAALRLKQAGRTVALLEARDRVGGRTFTEVLPDGTWIDRGGAWIGPGQDRIKALMVEFGVDEYKEYVDGNAMMVLDGKQHRYSGTIPWAMSPWAIANLGAGLLEVELMCKTIPFDAPWEAKKAVEWDRISLGEWINRHMRSKQAREMLEMALAGIYTSTGAEVSLLWALHQMGRAAGLASSSPTGAVPRMLGCAAAWAPYTGRCPPNWLRHCIFRSRCTSSRRTTMV
ncbi:hypothetical protein GCM10009632_49800 [Mycolicibacterium alvei]|uniref:Amine oxidase domain-containing protein n=1 Tax=Mycolicibacterium alvei TaxID=67081 RepID=A0A6N4UNA4_9MYCO|nr:hypothetical protein MALV_05500 [Mycolicibacterium alvei]